MNHPKENIINVLALPSIPSQNTKYITQVKRKQQRSFLVKKKKNREFPPHLQLNLIQCVCVTQMEGFDDSAQLYVLDVSIRRPQFPGIRLQKPGGKYFLSRREILNRRGGFRGDGKVAAVEQTSDGRGQSASGGSHLPGDCRVQITPQLLEISVRRVFHLEPLLLGGKKGHGLQKQGGEKHMEVIECWNSTMNLEGLHQLHRLPVTY